MGGGLAALAVAAAGLLQALDERALRLGLRDLGEIRIRDEAKARARGLGLADGHRATTPRGPAGPGRSGWTVPAPPARSPSSRPACGPGCSPGAWAWTSPTSC